MDMIKWKVTLENQNGYDKVKGNTGKSKWIYIYYMTKWKVTLGREVRQTRKEDSEVEQRREYIQKSTQNTTKTWKQGIINTHYQPQRLFVYLFINRRLIAQSTAQGQPQRWEVKRLWCYKNIYNILTSQMPRYYYTIVLSFGTKTHTNPYICNRHTCNL